MRINIIRGSATFARSMLVALALLGGCSATGSEAPNAGAAAPAPPSGQADQQAEPAGAMADGAITRNGRIYVPLTEADNARASWGSKLLSEMTVEEVAEAITARLGVYDGHGGYKMYRAIQPDLATAQAIRDQESMPGGPPQLTVAGVSGAEPEPRLDWLLNSSNPGVPQTTDPRSQPSNPFAYPYSTVVFVQQSNGNTTCTGTYVGPHQDTMLTAAHCNREHDSSSPPSSVTPADLNGYAPYGTFSGCYDWWYPTAWDTTISGGCPGSSACSQYDFTVIDYRPCGNPTIPETGTQGFAENSGSSQWASGIYHYGFPGFYAVSGNPPDTTQPGAIPPCGAGINPHGEFPFLCGQSAVPGGSVKFQVYNGSSCGTSGYDFLANAVTSSQGDSGGPWYYMSGGYPYEIAIETGDETLCGGPVNFGRFIDTTVWNFIFAYSNP